MIRKAEVRKGRKRKSGENKEIKRARLTSRNLPNTPLMHREKVLVNHDLDRTLGDMEHHVHSSRILAALDIVLLQLDASEAEEGLRARAA